jgi:hypothetical protein
LRICAETRAATPSKNAQTGLQQHDPALELGLAHRPLLGRRGREGDAPEVGRTGSDPVFHDLERPGGVELACHPGEPRDRHGELSRLEPYGTPGHGEILVTPNASLTRRR